MRSGPYLEIVLDKPELLVRGSFDEASASLLSGRLIVHLHEPIRVRSLKLVFSGRLDTTLNQNIVPYTVARDEHREIVRREWTFLEPQKPPVTWGPTKRVFPFDVLLPGDNPETIVTALGKVRYHVHATLERTSFHANLSASQEVFVKRGPIAGAPWALALMESIEATGEWSQQLDYRVSVPSRSLKDGEVFTTRFELEPRIKGMKLIAVGVLIKEYTRYYSTTGDALHRFSRVAARNENYVSQTGNCGVAPRMADDCLDLVDATNIQIPLAVPQAYGAIQYDVLTELIEVRHRIKFLIKLRDTNMLIHSIFIAVPVSIMPVTAQDESSILPRYEPTLTAGPGGGVVLMRSNTQPPAYEAVACRNSRAGPMPQQSNAGGARLANASGATPPPPPLSPLAMVGPGTVVDGFPGPIHRSGSQFYLASPDSSPPLQPVEYTQASSSAQTNNGALPSDTNTGSVASDSRRSSRSESRRGSVSSKAASLHEILAGSKLSDKVRSIFHARTPSTSSTNHHHHSRHHSRDANHTTHDSIRRPVTPPVIHDPHHSSSVAPAMVHLGYDLHQSPPYPSHAYALSPPGIVDAEISSLPVPHTIRPPPEALLRDHNKQSPHSDASATAASGTTSPALVFN